MGIQVLHSTEGMIAGLTPLNMAKERPLFSRILATSSDVLPH